ncbi:MAG: thymidine phosphorylase [Bacteroidota bacterium]|nr:thymidine phosphorylase [Candidatus Kapabacteria bacterium]MDW8220191.1 thymidine phosphorylase [Bacteroidota bacterium]
MIPAELLRKKRDGAELTKEEIQWFVRGITIGDITAPQAAAFLMAACIRGLSSKETAALTLAMRDSGTCYRFSTAPKPKVDKHSTGGVGDKISLLLLPLAASCGIAVPMISGRGLGHTGGTVDKLESVHVCMDINNERGAELLARYGGFFAKQTQNIAPADRILYHLRDVTGTVESKELITASILSKKFAEDLDALVIDLKVGQGAFMDTLDQAQALAETMLGVAQQVGLRMRIVFSSMEQPLGMTVGNWLEFEEALEALEHPSSTPPDIAELTGRLAASMLIAGGIAEDTATAMNIVHTAWASRKPLEIFHALIREQGGDIESSRAQYAHLPKKAICAPHDGVITGIHARMVGVAGIMIGAGRQTSEDTLDFGAGIVFHKKCGAEVRQGEEIGYVQSTRTKTLDSAVHHITRAISIEHRAYNPPPLILDEWDSTG